MPQAYPPQRGIGKRATKENATTASLAVERWDFRRRGLKRPLGKTKKAAPDVDRGPHALAARHRVRLSLVSLASQQSPTPFHQALSFTISGGGGSRKIPSGRLSPCLQKSNAQLPRSVLTNSYTVAERQPFQGEPRGESPTARCPKPTRRNAGTSSEKGLSCQMPKDSIVCCKGRLAHLIKPSFRDGRKTPFEF